MNRIDSKISESKCLVSKMKKSKSIMRDAGPQKIQFRENRNKSLLIRIIKKFKAKNKQLKQIKILIKYKLIK